MRQLDRNWVLDNHETLVKVLLQSLLYHPHLVNLIGYCADDNRLFLLYGRSPTNLRRHYDYGKLFFERLLQQDAYYSHKRTLTYSKT